MTKEKRELQIKIRGLVALALLDTFLLWPKSCTTIDIRNNEQSFKPMTETVMEKKGLSNIIRRDLLSIEEDQKWQEEGDIDARLSGGL